MKKFVLPIALLPICDGLLPQQLSQLSAGRRTITKIRPSQSSCSSLRMGGYDATIGPDPSTPIQFFTLPGKTCPYAARTLITLYELDIPFDTSEVQGQPKPDWYLKINPRGKVPALRLPACNNEVIYESAICNEFLCDYSATTLNKPQTLLPENPVQRARIRLLNDHADTVFFKTQFTFLMNNDTAKEWDMRLEMEEALAVYEEALAMSDGPFLVGEKFTLADIHILPFISRLIVSMHHFKNYELPSKRFPKLLEWYNTCSQRESVKQSSMTDEQTIEVYRKFVEVDYSFGGLNTNK